MSGVLGAGGWRRLRFIVVLAVGITVALGALIGMGSRGASAAGATTFAGSVRNENGYLRPGVTVALVDASTLATLTSTTTGADGTYAMTTSVTSAVKLRFSGTNVATVYNGNRAAAVAATAITPSGGTVSIDALVDSPGTIAGTVRHGDTLPNHVWVVAMHRDLNVVVGGVFTDANGRFQVSLPVGTYRIRVIDPQNLSNPATGYRTQMYPGDETNTFANGAALDVHAFRTVDGVDSFLSSVATCKASTFTTGANLSGRDLADCKMAAASLGLSNLSSANLQHADLSSAKLGYAVLSGASAHRARFAGANLGLAKLVGTDLREADLRTASLVNADLTNANLRGADLTGAGLGGVVWANTTCPDGASSDLSGGTCTGHLAGPRFTVNTTTDTADPSPGDGVCGSAGTCSLRAAVMEANAVGSPVTIDLVAGTTYNLTLSPADQWTDTDDTGDLDLRGRITLNGNGAEVANWTVARGGIDVFATANVTMTNVVITARGCCGDVGAAAVANRGTLVEDAVYVNSGSAMPALVNLGQSSVSRSMLLGTAGGVRNLAGATSVLDTTFDRGTSTALQLEVRGGTLSVGNSIVRGSCAGPITSADYNTTSDSTCVLTAAHDLVNASFELDTVWDGARTYERPYAGTPLVDSGRPGCASVDLLGNPRPVDGDGNGAAVCDRGAVELGPYAELTLAVNSTDAGTDANPGDHVCETATAGECTLPAAVAEANATNGPDTINLPPGLAFPMTGASLRGSLVVNGNGATMAASQGFTVPLGLSLTVHDASLMASGAYQFASVRGAATLDRTNLLGFGYGVSVSGSLSVNDAEIRGPTGGANAAGITSTGTVTLTRVLVADFSAVGISATAGTVNLRSTTVSSIGTSSTPAPGLSVAGANATVYDSTIAANTGSATVPGGIRVTSGAVWLVNTIVADQVAGADCAGTITSLDYNIDRDGTCGLTKAHDLPRTDPGLSPLVQMAGPRRQLMVTQSSPAVDSGRPICPALDMEGAARPQDGNGDGTKACDRGAVEAAPPVNHSFVVNSTVDAPDTHPGDGLCETPTPGECTFGAAVTEANASNGVDTITLQPGATYPTTAVNLWSTVTLVGNGATVGQVQWWGTDTFQTDHLTSSLLWFRRGHAIVTASNVTAIDGDADLSVATSTVGNLHESGVGVVTDSQVGYASSDPGGVLTLQRVTGQGVGAAGTLHLIQSTFTNNEWTALDVGSGATVTVDRTTFDYNATNTWYAGEKRTVRVAAGGSLTITDSTLTSDYYSGIAIENVGGTVTVTNSILSFASANPTCVGPITSGGYNLADDNSCGLTAPTDLPGRNVVLAGVFGSPGQVPVREPSNGSPAIDSGRPGCSGADPRGVARPQDGDGDGTAACDRGAAEARVPVHLSFTVNTTADLADANPGDGLCQAVGYPSLCSARAAIDEANHMAGSHTITLQSGAAYHLAGDLAFDRAVTLNGNGSSVTVAGWSVPVRTAGVVQVADVTVLAATGNQPNWYAPAGDVRFQNAVVPGGYVTSGQSLTVTGGGSWQSIVTTGNATLANTIVSGNLTTSGTTTVSGSTLGGLYVTGGATTVARAGTSAVTVSGGSLQISSSTLEGSVTAPALAVSGGTVVATDDTVTRSRWDVKVTGGAVTFTSSIIAVDPIFGGPACTGPVASGGWNLATDSTCALTGTNDLQGVSPKFGLRRTDLGPNPLYLPLPGSPVVDSGRPGCAGTDERGVPRGTDGDGDGLGGCERGAIELGAWNPLTLDVTSTADRVDAVPGDGICQTSTAGECTVRAAIMEANATNGTDTINLQAGATYLLTLGALPDNLAASGDLDVFSGVVIHGNDASITGVQGYFKEPAFDVRFDVPLSIDRLTFANSQTTALSNAAGNVTLTRCTFTANVEAVYNAGTVLIVDSTMAGQTYAGLYDNGGQATLLRSTVSGTTGTGVQVNGATAHVTVDTSTLSGNTTGLAATAGTTTITRSTIAANGSGGVAVTSPASVTVVSSIVANQTGGANCTGSVVSGGFNASSDASCAFAAAGDVNAVTVALGPLADNGGPTKTHLPPPGSAVIGTGQPGCSGTDQRGVLRPQGGACDKGSVEQ